MSDILPLLSAFAGQPVEVSLPPCDAPAFERRGEDAVVVRCTSPAWSSIVRLRGAARIRRNERVPVSIDGAGFSISASMTAMEDGRAGQPLRLRDGQGRVRIGEVGPHGRVSLGR